MMMPHGHIAVKMPVVKICYSESLTKVTQGEVEGGVKWRNGLGKCCYYH